MNLGILIDPRNGKTYTRVIKDVCVCKDLV